MQEKIQESVMKIVAIQICSLYTGIKIMRQAAYYSHELTTGPHAIIGPQLNFAYWFSFAIASFNIVLMIRQMRCKIISCLAISTYIMIQGYIMVKYYMYAQNHIVELAHITGSRGLFLVHCLTLVVLVFCVGLAAVKMKKE